MITTNKKYPSPRNQSGFSIVELMVVSGIALIIITGIGSMTQLQTQGVFFLEDKLERINLEKDITRVLEGPTACMQSLGGAYILGAIGTETPLPSILDEDGNTYLAGNSVYEKLNIGAITIRNNGVSAGTTGEVEIIIPVERRRQGGGPTTLKPIEKRVNMEVDASMVVQTCGSLGYIRRCRVCINKNQGTRGVKPAFGANARCTNFVGPGDRDVTVRVVDHGSHGREEALGIECQ